jgi:tagatose-6-phosphate ketose/aldose isomerase
MLLATWCVLGGVDDRVMVDTLARSAEAVLADLEPYARVASRGYARVVFLGSGPLAGLAHEAALKLLELTAGRVISYFDTALGFRHGPKSVVDEQTLVVVFRSTDPYTGRYDDDIAAELRATAGPDVIMVATDPARARTGDWVLAGAGGLAEVPLAALYAVAAQLLGLHVSVALGCTPDNPFPTGEVNRVVEGVTVHPLA